eukprot:scaffold37750_cov33-Tisochrysis_lutea.AAC.2
MRHGRCARACSKRAASAFSDAPTFGRMRCGIGTASKLRRDSDARARISKVLPNGARGGGGGKVIHRV